ncbi:MAG: aspartate kinase [Myxococcota bacterium]
MGQDVAIRVQKYGGSSVADLDRIHRVAERIAATVAEGHQVVVVCSAMGNTTNELLALARSVSASPSRRELDMLVSVGERIAMALLAMALIERGVPARSLTGSQSGIVTNEAHADAKVVEVRPARLQQVLDQGEVAIVAGFQGVSREREVTTLGRGGSDTTAVVLAAALGAEHCEICSDVDGVWSADPRIVKAAARVDALSLDEGVALARGGAKVLFEDALQFARDNGVVLRAVSTFGPGAGTRLTSHAQPRTGPVAVTGDILLRLRCSAPLTDASRSLEEAGARVRRRQGDTLWLDLRNAHGALPPLGETLTVGMVTVVGSGLGARLAVIAELEDALSPFSPTRCGASGDAAWWEVHPDQLDDAVRAAHALCQ